MTPPWLLVAVAGRTSTPSLKVISGRSVKRGQEIVIFLIIVIIAIVLLVSTGVAHELLLLQQSRCRINVFWAPVDLVSSRTTNPAIHVGTRRVVRKQRQFLLQLQRALKARLRFLLLLAFPVEPYPSGCIISARVLQRPLVVPPVQSHLAADSTPISRSAFGCSCEAGRIGTDLVMLDSLTAE